MQRQRAKQHHQPFMSRDDADDRSGIPKRRPPVMKTRCGASRPWSRRPACRARRSTPTSRRVCSRSNDGSACGALRGSRPMSGPGWRAGRNSAGSVVHYDGGGDVGNGRRGDALQGGCPYRAACRSDGALPDWLRQSSSRRAGNEENEQEVRMSGSIDGSDAPGIPAEHLNSVAVTARAVRGILWGAELAATEMLVKSMVYNAKWWSRGDSNQCDCSDKSVKAVSPLPQTVNCGSCGPPQPLLS